VLRLLAFDREGLAGDEVVERFLGRLPRCARQFELPKGRGVARRAVGAGRSGRWFSVVGGEIRWPPLGRFGDRQWGDPVAAYGENLMAAVTGE
jgi:hypothetical protein